MSLEQMNVRAFHEKYGHPVNTKPTDPGLEMRDFRAHLVREEALELIAELQRPDVRMDAVAQEMVDVLYVVYGTAVVMGIDLSLVWDAVHSANMQKIHNGLMKPKKPQGWVPPDIKGIIERQAQ